MQHNKGTLPLGGKAVNKIQIQNYPILDYHYLIPKKVLLRRTHTTDKIPLEYAYVSMITK